MYYLLRTAGTPISELVTDIYNQDTHDERVKKMLTKLVAVVTLNEADSVFESFLSALRRDGQEHVANIFLPQTEARPMSDEHYEALTKQQSEVCKFLDPENGLLDVLVDDGAFKASDRRRVKAAVGVDAMASETIDILSRKADSAFDSVHCCSS